MKTVVAGISMLIAAGHSRGLVGAADKSPSGALYTFHYYSWEQIAKAPGIRLDSRPGS